MLVLLDLDLDSMLWEMKPSCVPVSTGTNLSNIHSQESIEFIIYSKNNRVIDITDVDCNIESMIRENIRQHADNNMYIEYQQKHKDLSLSLHQSVEDEYKLKEGRFSPEVIIPSIPQSSVC